MKTEFDMVADAAQHIRDRGVGEVELTLVLGSGLGEFAEQVGEAVTIPWAEIPGFPSPSVSSHAGRLVVGELGGVRVAVMQGRVHFYEGYTASEVVRPLRTLIALGARAVVVTNAAGGIDPALQVGDLMLIDDQINLTGQSPLHGTLDPRWPSRFVDLTGCYHPGMTRAVLRVGEEQGLELKRGVYAGLAGGAYETPAEIHMLGLLGAHAVGMSTVLEVIAANHLGARVAGISCITNLAAGKSTTPLTHEEVKDTASRSRGTFARLLATAVPLLAAAAGA
ncbi:MAG: purine-nucleoside phosphorylase [Deltaproteobacteria bacterium]|nr:purine-nucleoside phosphorylase [Deltaproteobacteria bacterium]